MAACETRSRSFPRALRLTGSVEDSRTVGFLSPVSRERVGAGDIYRIAVSRRSGALASLTSLVFQRISARHRRLSFRTRAGGKPVSRVRLTNESHFQPAFANTRAHVISTGKPWFATVERCGRRTSRGPRRPSANYEYSSVGASVTQACFCLQVSRRSRLAFVKWRTMMVGL